MPLFVIGDPHLSFGCEKPMDIFRGWQDYTLRLGKNWCRVVSPEDTVVVAGDISWAMSLEEGEKDFAFLDSLPGKKLLLKGNHDYWWSTRKKMEAFFEKKGFLSLRIIHNNAVRVENISVCGTRGWFYDAEKDAEKKVLLREAGRLRASILEAQKLGGEPVAFLHYPPVYSSAVCEEMMQVLEESGIKRCFYGHLHGASIGRAVQGEYRGIEFRLVSCDALNFCPLRVL